MSNPLYDNRLPVPTRIGPPVISAVRKKASSLIEYVVKRCPEWTPPPFTPDVIAEELGIDVVRLRFDSRYDALIRPDGNSFCIAVNTKYVNEGRRNFSVAHELAHTLFKDARDRLHHRTTDKASAHIDNPVLERLCDIGAAELVMPLDYFRVSLREFGFDVDAIRSIAARYHVSFQAAALRAVGVRGEPASAVAFYHLAPKPSCRKTNDVSSNSKYRVCRRPWKHPRFPFLPVGKSVPSTSVIYRASLTDGMQSDRELMDFGRDKFLVDVTARALRRPNDQGEPPTICATLSLIGRRG